MSAVFTFSWTPAEYGITHFTLDISSGGMPPSHYDVYTDGTTNTQTSGEFVFNEGDTVHVELRAVNSFGTAGDPAVVDFVVSVHPPLAPVNFAVNFVRFQ